MAHHNSNGTNDSFTTKSGRRTHHKPNDRHNDDDDEDEPSPKAGKAKTKSQHKGTSCHQCKSIKPLTRLTFCTNSFEKRTKPGQRKCRKKYCDTCLQKFYNRFAEEGKSWICASCRGVCTCAACIRQNRSGPPPTSTYQPNTPPTPNAPVTPPTPPASHVGHNHHGGHGHGHGANNNHNNNSNIGGHNNGNGNNYNSNNNGMAGASLPSGGGISPPGGSSPQGINGMPALTPLQIQYLQQQLALQHHLQMQLQQQQQQSNSGGQYRATSAFGGTSGAALPLSSTPPQAPPSITPTLPSLPTTSTSPHNGGVPLSPISVASTTSSQRPHMTLATSGLPVGNGLNPLNGLAGSLLAGGVGVNGTGGSIEAELAQQFHYHLQLQQQLQALRPAGMASLPNLLQPNMANLALLYPQLLAAAAAGGSMPGGLGNGMGSGGGGVPTGMPPNLGSPGGGLAGYDVEQYQSQAIPRLGGASSMDDLLSPDTTPSISSRGLSNAALGIAPSPNIGSGSGGGGGNGNMNGALRHNAGTTPSMMLSPRGLNGKPRTPGGSGSNGSTFRFLSRAQQQAALQDDLTALKRGSLSHDILDVAQFVDETPDAGEPSFSSLMGMGMGAMGHMNGHGLIPPPPPPFLSATGGRYQSPRPLPPADGSPQAPRAELEDSYRVSSRRAAASRDSPLRTPPTPATPSISMDPKNNVAFRYMRGSDRMRPSDLQPSPDLASDRLGPRRKAMLASANNALMQSSNIGNGHGNGNSSNIGLGQFGIGDKEVDAKDSSALSHTNTTTNSDGSSNSKGTGSPQTGVRPVKQPRSSPAALLSKLRIQDEELKKSGADGKSPQYSDSETSSMNGTSNGGANKSSSNNFARAPPMGSSSSASSSSGFPSSSSSSSASSSSNSNVFGSPALAASMFMTSPNNPLAYLPASAGTLPMSAFGTSPSASPLTGYGSLPQFTTISPALGYGVFGTPTGSTFGLSPSLLLGSRTMVGTDGSPVDAADGPNSNNSTRRRVARGNGNGSGQSPTPLSPMRTFGDFEAYTD